MIFSRVSLLVAGMAVCICVARGQTETGTAKLVGDWTGESICVGEIGSCHDETVVYHISLDASDPTKVKMGADKIVNGKPDFMGEGEFAYDAKKQTLVSEFKNARVHLVIEFAVKDDVIEGVVAALPERTVVRNIKVKKDR